MICLKRGFIYPFHLSKLNWAIAINIIPKGRTMYWLSNIRYDQSMTKICTLAWWDCVTCETCDDLCYMQITCYTWVSASLLHAEHMLHMVNMSVCECVTWWTHVTHGTHECLRVCYMQNTCYTCYTWVLHAERPAEFFLGRSLGSHVKSKHELSENEIFCWWQKSE